MFYYGFLIENNRKNTVYVKLSLNKDKMCSAKAKLIGCSESSYIKTFKYFEEFKENYQKNQKFLGYLRFIEYTGDLNLIGSTYMTPAVVSASTCVSKHRKLKLPAFSVENEKAMLRKLREIAKACLKKYPQTYEEDMELLKKELTFNERNCIIYRSGEKRIYGQMVEMADLGLELLCMECAKANAHYEKQRADLPYKIYFETSLLPLLKQP